MIELRDVTQSFHGRRVLSGVSFTIAPGELVTLGGPSGVGKSTLARIMAGHLKPDSGRVLIEGHDRTGQPGRDVFLIHQENDLFPWLRVEDQIAMALPRPDAARVRELISLVKLSGFERHFPRELSGGMKKRLAIARALAVRPKLMILDESFSSLDEALRRALFSELREIWKKTGTAILIISHHLTGLADEMGVSGQRTIRL